LHVPHQGNRPPQSTNLSTPTLELSFLQEAAAARELWVIRLFASDYS
jgi:hypothetical protein